MSKKIRLFIIAVAVMLGATFAATTAAQASTGLRSSSTSIGVSGRLTLNGIVTCDVLLQLALSSNTIAKVVGTQIGTATGTIANCTGGASGGGAVLGPIPVFYESFSGPLPTGITNIRVNAGSAARPVGFSLANILTCSANTLFGGAADPNLDDIDLRVSGGRVTSADFNSSEPLSRNSGSGLFCPGEGTIRGALTTFLSPGAPTITLV